MGQTYKADFQVDNGTDYDKYNFSTSADQVSYAKNGKETNVQAELDAVNTGIKGTKADLTLVNGFTGTAWYVKYGSLVLISAAVTCPGNAQHFAVMPSQLIPAQMQFGPAWLQTYGGDDSDFNQIIGSVTIRGKSDTESGKVQIRNWSGATLLNGTIARIAFTYYIG